MTLLAGQINAATSQNEAYEPMIARHGIASHIEPLVGKYRRVCRKREPQAESERETGRELSWYRDEEEVWAIRHCGYSAPHPPPASHR